MGEYQDNQENLRKGFLYEEQIARILENDKHIVLRTGQLFGRCDMGIDLISYKNGNLYLYQCKNYEKAKIKPTHIISFFGACFWFCHEFEMWDNIKRIFICPKFMDFWYYDHYSYRVYKTLDIILKEVEYKPLRDFVMPIGKYQESEWRNTEVAKWLKDNGIITEEHYSKILNDEKSINHYAFENYVLQRGNEDVHNRIIDLENGLSVAQNSLIEKDNEIKHLRADLDDAKNTINDLTRKLSPIERRMRIKESTRGFLLALAAASLAGTFFVGMLWALISEVKTWFS